MRQIIGWREFIRGVYWHDMPDYAERNALECDDRDVPAFFWDGETDMHCVAQCMRSVVDRALRAPHPAPDGARPLRAALGRAPAQFHEWHMAMYARRHRLGEPAQRARHEPVRRRRGRRAPSPTAPRAPTSSACPTTAGTAATIQARPPARRLPLQHLLLGLPGAPLGSASRATAAWDSSKEPERKKPAEAEVHLDGGPPSCFGGIDEGERIERSHASDKLPSIEDARVRRLNDRRRPGPDGRYVLYWMQSASAPSSTTPSSTRSSRPTTRTARWSRFGLTDDYPEANERHYPFLLAGPADVPEAWRSAGSSWWCGAGTPPTSRLRLARGRPLVVCDRGYLRHQRAGAHGSPARRAARWSRSRATWWCPSRWRRQARVRGAHHPPEAHRALGSSSGRRRPRPGKDSTALASAGSISRRPSARSDRLDLDRSVGARPRIEGGTPRGPRLRRFPERRSTATRRTGPHRDRRCLVHEPVPALRPDLAGGDRARGPRRARGAKADREAYLEELIVRRELAENFVHFDRDYDRYALSRLGAEDPRRAPRRPARARPTRGGSSRPPRPTTATGTPPCARCVSTGFMHNYMRMYWGKKILEWSNTPEYAFRTAL